MTKKTKPHPEAERLAKELNEIRDEANGVLPEPKDAITKTIEEQLEAESDDWVACEHLARIKEASVKADKAKEKMDDTKEKYIQAKKFYDSLVEDLRDIIREETVMPLFDANKKKPATDKPTDDEGWKDIDLAEAMPEISAKVIEKLAEAELKTVGQLSRYTAEVPLNQIKGIGEATVVKIEEAMTAFWKRRNEEKAVAENEELSEALLEEEPKIPGVSENEIDLALVGADSEGEEV